MKVAIVGAGGIACSYAAVLASRDHAPMIWSPSGARGAELAAGAQLTATGALEGSYDVAVAASAAELVKEAPAVILALPAYGHKAVIDRIVPELVSGQTVIVSAHLSFSALYLSRKLTEAGKDCPVVVWNTTASTGRQAGPTGVSISLLRREVEIAVIPRSAAAAALELCAAMFGDKFRLVDDLIGVDLGNLNPTVHYGIALFNLTRMELGETWSQQAHITPAVCRFLEDLDSERRAVADALGVSCRSIHQSYAIPGKVEIGPLADMMAETVKIRPPVNGPKTLDTRYVTEDVPYGLLTVMRLAEMVGVQVPLHNAGLLIFSSLYGRDFITENEILPGIAEAMSSLETLRRATADGWAAV